MSERGQQEQGGGGLARSAQTAFPSDYRPIVFEGFESLNVKAPRAAILDNEMAWCDGWMPIAPNVLRILPDAGSAMYAAPAGLTVVWHGYGNIGNTNYGYVLLSNGRLDAFDTASGVTQSILPAGSVFAPDAVFGMSQWGSTFALFAKDQINGYWVWDGSHTFTAGAINPEITISNAGSEYSSAPLVTMQTTGAGGSVAFNPQVDNGSVVKVGVASPGSGFSVDDFVALNVTGGGSDNQALPFAPTVHGDWAGVKTVSIIEGGSAYTSRAYGTFTGGGRDPTGTDATCSLAIQNGTITAIAITGKGAGYTSPPDLVITDPGIPGTPDIPGGAGFVGEAQIEFGQVTSVSISSGGTGYLSPPDVVIIGDGIGAAGIATVNGNAVTAVRMTDFGTGYTRALAVFQRGNKSANLLASVFPFGISGTAIETYRSRVWISNGAAEAVFPPRARVIYSDPETPTGFGNGGGAFASTDSFLRVGYHWLKQSNGFLYLGGDSSTNYISGVTTAAPSAGDVPITTFVNTNVDPQIGSPWPTSVQVFSRNVVLANPQGIYVSYGGAMTKISTPLDPLYASCPTLNVHGTYFSSAVAQIFGVPVYMLLLPVVDVYTGNIASKLLMWDGKRWFTSQQSRGLTFIAAQEVNSNLTAWGTDGTNIFPLFASPSTNFTKVVQTKMFSFGYFMTKVMSRLQGLAQVYAVDQTLDIAIDSSDPSNVPSPVYSVLPGVGGTWFGAGGAVGGWTGLAGAPGSWSVSGGLGVFGPIPVGQWGRMLGFTIVTQASDISLMSLLGEAQDYSANV